MPEGRLNHPSWWRTKEDIWPCHTRGVNSGVPSGGTNTTSCSVRWAMATRLVPCTRLLRWAGADRSPNSDWASLPKS